MLTVRYITEWTLQMFYKVVICPPEMSALSDSMSQEWSYFSELLYGLCTRHYHSFAVYCDFFQYTVECSFYLWLMMREYASGWMAHCSNIAFIPRRQWACPGIVPGTKERGWGVLWRLGEVSGNFSWQRFNCLSGKACNRLTGPVRFY